MLTRTAPRIVRYDATDAEIVSATPPRFTVTWLGDMLTPDANSFGVLRLLFAGMVLVSHTIYLATGQATAEPLYGWTNYTLGQHGVQLFFILSGILVAQSLWQSGSVRDYATARALRIFPALIVCALVTALIAGPWLSVLPATTYLGQGWVALYIAKTVSLVTGSAELPGLFVDNPAASVVNSSVWTLKYEVLCYAILALAGALVLRWRATRVVLAGLVAVWLAAVFVRPVGLELHGGAKSMLDVLRYFTLFFGTGVLAYVFRRFIPVHGLLLAPLALAFWAAIGTRFQEPAAALFLGYGAIWLATFQFGALRAYTRHNDYSYGTYLYHMPVTQALLHLYPDMPVPALLAMTAGIVLVLAFLSWELVERPALALRHTLWSSLDTGRAAAVLRRALGGMRRQAGSADATSATAGAESAVVAPRVVRSDAASAPARPAAAGTARVWRPMAQRRRLDVDGREPVSPSRGHDRPKVPAALSGRTRPVEPETAPPPRADLSGPRLAMALQRKRPPAATAEPAHAAPVRAPSRAVIAIVDPA